MIKEEPKKFLPPGPWKISEIGNVCTTKGYTIVRLPHICDHYSDRAEVISKVVACLPDVVKLLKKMEKEWFTASVVIVDIEEMPMEEK